MGGRDRRGGREGCYGKLIGLVSLLNIPWFQGLTMKDHV